MEQDDLMTFRRKLVEKLSISTMEGFSLIRLNEILYLEADGNYTVMHLTNDKKSYQLKTWAISKKYWFMSLFCVFTIQKS